LFAKREGAFDIPEEIQHQEQRVMEIGRILIASEDWRTMSSRGRD
jgi:hypothetical protein